MTSRRGDFHGPSPEGLAPHVGQVGLLRRWPTLGPRGDARPGGVPSQNGHQFAQRGRTPHLLAADECRLTDVTERHDHAEGACRVGQGDHAGHVAQ